MFKQKAGTPWQRPGRIDSGKVWKYGVDIGLDDSGRGFKFSFCFLSVTFSDSGKRLSKPQMGKIVATSLTNFHADLTESNTKIQTGECSKARNRQCANEEIYI